MNPAITSVRDLIDAVATFSTAPLMFRGQGQDWPLLPAIGRYPVGNYAANWQSFHDDIIARFLRFGAPFFKTYPTSDMEKWVFAQHHGLPTRLLDTGLNPLKAMHFAVGNPKDDNVSGSFWIFQYDGWREELDDAHRKYWDVEITPFLPAQIHPRLTAQEGAFICYPLPKHSEPLPPLDALPSEMEGGEYLYCHKYLVPAGAKSDIRREITSLGARHSLLFPDLDGVAREITLDLLEGL
jgi:FRG domain